MGQKRRAERPFFYRFFLFFGDAEKESGRLFGWAGACTGRPHNPATAQRMRRQTRRAVGISQQYVFVLWEVEVCVSQRYFFGFFGRRGRRRGGGCGGAGEPRDDKVKGPCGRHAARSLHLSPLCCNVLLLRIVVVLLHPAFFGLLLLALLAGFFCFSGFGRATAVPPVSLLLFYSAAGSSSSSNISSISSSSSRSAIKSSQASTRSRSCCCWVGRERRGGEGKATRRVRRQRELGTASGEK